jgi:hypothetical protein
VRVLALAAGLCVTVGFEPEKGAHNHLVVLLAALDIVWAGRLGR